MSLIDNTLAAQVPTFDPATPLAQAGKLQAMEQENRAAQFKQAQTEIGSEARGLQPFVNTPEFPAKWAETADRLLQKGLLNPQTHAQWRNSPSPLMLKQMIASTEDPTLTFRKEEAGREQKNQDRSFGLQKTNADRTYGLAVRAADRADDETPDNFEANPDYGKVAGAPKYRPIGPADPNYLASVAKAKTLPVAPPDGFVRQPNGALAPDEGGPQDPKYIGAVAKAKAEAEIKPPPKNQFHESLLKKDADRVDGYSDSAKLAEEGAVTLDYIDGLRKQAFTGPIAGWAANKIGHPATQALDGAVNALSLDIAQKMKGSLSDKDIVFVKSQTPALAMGGQAGEAASGSIRAAFERTQQRAAFYRTWAEKNGGIDGADVSWKKYVTENPLTTEDKKALGGRKFNPDYNKDFSPYIKGGQSGSGNGADATLAYAREALAKGAPRGEIEKRLVGAGIDPKDL